MGCGETTVKYFLFFVNLIFAISGLSILFIGVAMEVKLSHVTKINGLSFEMAPISGMVIGCIVFIIAFLGCCGAILENYCMLVTYSIFMLILMILKVALAIIIFVKMDIILDQILITLNKSFASTAFKEFEITFKCCGSKGPGSYGNTKLPDSCCPSAPCSLKNSYPGCESVIQQFFKVHDNVIAYLVLILGILELLAAVMAVCLANDVRNKKRSAQSIRQD